MTKTVLYDSLSECFPSLETPDWYREAVSYLRGDKDRGLFGLYLYNLVRTREDITEIINIGTARGHSAVCAAKGLEAAGRRGSVHTIDVIDPDEVRDWYDGHSGSDPLHGVETSMRELVSRFQDSSDKRVRIEFYAGDSNEVIPTIEAAPDLVFHDGRHTSRAVKRDVEAANALSDERPIHVFDDCYLYDNRWTYRPCSGELWDGLAEVPKLGGLVRALRSVTVSHTPVPGVTMAVRDVIDDDDPTEVEVVRDRDHAPITTVVS